jgi:pimeloyl-ACP methyl ester carboxylesterase
MPVAGAVGGVPDDVTQAESWFAAGTRQEEQRLEGCVDSYYQAALRAWRRLESASGGVPYRSDYDAASKVYQQSLDRLIACSVRYGRLDPRGRLVVVEGAWRVAVPIEYYGFAWQPGEFCQVLSAGDFQSHDVQKWFRAGGLGVSLIAVRHARSEEQFYQIRQPFSVTAVLRPASNTSMERYAAYSDANAEGRGAVLALYNPCVVDSLRVGSTVVGMERDLTAPFGYVLRESPRKYTEGFLDPDDADIRPKLFMMEPYQRNKIPVVFIHGLWSDPATWVDMVNELRVHGDLYRRYQFWFFRYPTGGELLESAAELRGQLQLARGLFDPQHQDAALEQTVLVGHSMGGLVAELQVTHSADLLWRCAANRPFDAVRAPPEAIWRLQRMFFFTPSPLVKRVVFIGTPHQGSGMSRRAIGRVASSLVQYSSSAKAQYRQLIDNNKDVFKEYLWKSRPTTIDLLEPSNPMLSAMAKMRVDTCVARHSIIGTGGAALTGELSDGVVPVSSARQAGDCSELFVPARHDKLHHDAASIAEVMRILRQVPVAANSL